MAFVLDSSMTLAWLLPDESHAAADAIGDRLLTESVIVPSVWPLEISNALLVAWRRNRLSESEIKDLLHNVRRLPIEVDTGSLDDCAVATTELALQYELSSYDASYLELSLRLKLPLATLDKKLLTACAAAKITVL